MLLEEILKFVAGSASVRWIDYDGKIKFINYKDVWHNDNFKDIFTKNQLNQQVDYFTAIDDDIIIMLKEELKWI